MKHIAIIAAAAWFLVEDVPTLAAESPGILLSTNTEAPFCFRRGGVRTWPVCSAPLPPGTDVQLVISQGGAVLASGRKIEFEGISVELLPSGKLQIRGDRADAKSIELEIRVAYRGSEVETQKLEIRPAPPNRPISYYADFGDEIIRIFMNSATGQFRPVDKGGLDQYFRRLQAHGVTRLIVWQSPFPLIVDSKNYLPDEWNNYQAQAEAILGSESLDATFRAKSGYKSWAWIRQLMSLRSNSEFGHLLTQSAAEHEIALTASYRPFEAALSKYYYVPTFDQNGKFLWNFLPMASPAINYHPDQVAFAHYRQILSASRYANQGRLASLRFRQAGRTAEFLNRWHARRDNLRIVAAPFPPLQDTSFVLQRQADGRFILRRYAELRNSAESHLTTIRDGQLDLEPPDTIRVQNLRVPFETRYLWISNPTGEAGAIELDSVRPVELYSAAGNRLGRENIYWAAAKSAPETRVGGITDGAEFYTEFQTTEASIALFSETSKRSLVDDILVISLGELFSSEILDFNLPRSRAVAIAELQTILAHKPFDEVFVNTRTHTQLAGNYADGDLGLAPLAEYKAKSGRLRAWLGVDLAYAPRSIGRTLKLQQTRIETPEFEKLTTWQPGEWLGPCQSAESPFVWRRSRNLEIAAGIRKLLTDMEAAFPKNRIRVVLPEREGVTKRMHVALEEMKQPDGTPYGRDYLQGIIGTLNYAPSMCEAMTLVDLSGLRVEPVLLGIRYLPAREPFKRFIQEALVDLTSNRGSKFRGPRSFFYEAQETLRAADPIAARREREHHICHVLSLKNEIGEVILYEAADWAYFLPISDAAYCGHNFLDECK